MLLFRPIRHTNLLVATIDKSARAKITLQDQRSGHHDTVEERHSRRAGSGYTTALACAPACCRLQNGSAERAALLT